MGADNWYLYQKRFHAKVNSMQFEIRVVDQSDDLIAEFEANTCVPNAGDMFAIKNQLWTVIMRKFYYLDDEQMIVDVICKPFEKK
ncbi:MAG: hypothetical protein KDB00_13885 [Planctomycetales bacterium]|nr:hypothetical protein [Planctomycetales bacterium]